MPHSVLAVRCYQCSTQTDVKGVDSCGAYKRFNASEHIAIECNSDESHMPGSFCMKVVQQGPRGFICKFVFISWSSLFAFSSLSQPITSINGKKISNQTDIEMLSIEIGFC